MNQTIQALAGWREYCKWYKEKGGNMHQYYRDRLAESPICAIIFTGCIIAAAVLIIVAKFAVR